MRRFLTALALAPAAIVLSTAIVFAQAQPLTIADPNAVQAGPVLQFFIQFILPAFGTVLTALVGWLVWVIKQKTGIQIDAQYRDAFQKALEQAAGGLLNSLGDRVGKTTISVGNPGMAQAINYVLKSAPDAVAKFGLDNKRDEIAEKIAAKIGVLTAGPPAVTVSTPAPSLLETSKGAPGGTG